MFVSVTVLVALLVGILGMSVTTTPWIVVKQGVTYKGPLVDEIVTAFIFSIPPCPLPEQCHLNNATLPVELVWFQGSYYYLYYGGGTYNGITEYADVLFTNSTVYCSYPAWGTWQVCPIH